LHQQLASENYLEAVQYVHCLKGAAGNIGAKLLHQACVEIEISLKSRQSPEQLAHFIEVFTNTLQACRDYLQSTN